MDDLTGIIAVSIPIFALMIPIVAILVKSNVGLALAKYLENKAKSSSSGIENLIKTEQYLLSLDQKMHNLEMDVRLLRESHDNLARLLKSGESNRQLKD